MSDKSNAFINEGLQKNDGVTENGALAHSTTGSNFVDDFANAGTYRHRTAEEVNATMQLLWNEDKLESFKMLLYLRMITRKTVISSEVTTEAVQKGQGLKDEAVKRLLWIAYNDEKWFYKNLLLMPLAGSWRDVWNILYFDFSGENKINRTKVYAIMKEFLGHENVNHDLFLKFMPLIQSRNKQKTTRSKALSIFSYELRKYLNMSVPAMRKMKTESSAHVFQQLISTRKFKKLNFKNIPGKALSMLTSGNFLQNNNLEKEYMEFLMSQPTVKFTGYPYELGKRVMAKRNLSMVEEMTINKQFDGLIQLAQDDGVAGLGGNIWCAIDTSGSMGCNALEDGTTPFDICVSMGIYFSSLNTGAFKDNVIMFDDRSKVLKLTGKDFVAKHRQITSLTDSMGGTNFQSVIDEVCRIRRTNPLIPITDYPETLLVISDMQFNPSGSYWTQATESQRLNNYANAMAKLKSVGLPHIKVIWWQVRPGGVQNFPSNTSEPGTYAFSGFDGSVITLLLGAEEKVNEKGEKVQLSMEETMYIALNQSLMSYITVPGQLIKK